MQVKANLLHLNQLNHFNKLNHCKQVNQFKQFNQSNQIVQVNTTNALQFNRINKSNQSRYPIQSNQSPNQSLQSINPANQPNKIRAIPNQPIKQTINPNNQSIHPNQIKSHTGINQSINQPTNQSTNQSSSQEEAKTNLVFALLLFVFPLLHVSRPWHEYVALLCKSVLFLRPWQKQMPANHACEFHFKMICKRTFSAEDSRTVKNWKKKIHAKGREKSAELHQKQKQSLFGQYCPIPGSKTNKLALLSDNSALVFATLAWIFGFVLNTVLHFVVETFAENMFSCRACLWAPLHKRPPKLTCYAKASKKVKSYAKQTKHSLKHKLCVQYWPIPGLKSNKLHLWISSALFVCDIGMNSWCLFGQFCTLLRPWQKHALLEVCFWGGTHKHTLQ